MTSFVYSCVDPELRLSGLMTDFVVVTFANYTNMPLSHKYRKYSFYSGEITEIWLAHRTNGGGCDAKEVFKANNLKEELL